MVGANLELDLLRAFVAVAEAGSFTAAASRIGRFQSAASQKILRIEQIIGEAVFLRTSRRIRLTGAGERVLGYARDAIGAHDAFLAALKGAAAIRLLRLGISENLIPTQLTKLVSAFLNANPETRLELSTGLSPELFELYEREELDALIVRPKDNQPSAGRVVWREPLVWAAADGSEVDLGKPIRLVTLKPPCGYRDIMADALNSCHRPWITVCVANSLVALDAAVAAGVGVTILGKSFLRPGLRALTQLPELPQTEVMVVGGDGPLGGIVRPLERFLADNIRGTALLNAT